MKNPQITTRLNQMMQKEQETKIQMVGCIIDNYRQTAPNLVNGDTFNKLLDIDIMQLNSILNALIEDLYASKEYQLNRRKACN